MTKTYVGRVTGLKNLPRTIVVSIKIIKNDKKYHKSFFVEKKKQVHVDKKNEGIKFNINDKVKIINSRPYSATKRFLFLEKI